MDFYYVTGNANKLREARAIPGDGLKSIEIDLPEYQGSPEYIVTQKAKLAAEQTGKNVFVDDVGLCFDAWGGMPGPFIKFFLKSMSLEQLAAAVIFTHNVNAQAVCSIGYCGPGEEPKVFTGAVRGIVTFPRGRTDFGWDPIFLPEGYTKTFAEMSPDEKNAISHRRLALESLKEYLFR